MAGYLHRTDHAGGCGHQWDDAENAGGQDTREGRWYRGRIQLRRQH